MSYEESDRRYHEVEAMIFRFLLLTLAALVLIAGVCSWRGARSDRESDKAESIATEPVEQTAHQQERQSDKRSPTESEGPEGPAGQATANAEDPAGTAADVSWGFPYMPLHVGCKWVYRMRRNDRESKYYVEVLKHETLNKVLCARVESMTDWDAAFEHLSVTREGVFRLAYKGSRANPPVLVVPQEVEEEKSWGGEYEVAGMRSARRWTIVAVDELVEVPAGKFNTVVIRGVDPSRTGWVNTKYYAEGVGVVKEIHHQGQNHSETELLEFTAGDRE
jgi:hypothetical protein